MPVSEQSASVLPATPLTSPYVGQTLEKFGRYFVRYSLALVLVWMGLMKFTGFEAAAIEPMVANSPILFWLYDFLSVQAVSNLIGVIEITAAVLLATRPWSATAGILGGALAVATFITTLAMIFTLPSWEPNPGFGCVSKVVEIGFGASPSGLSFAAVRPRGQGFRRRLADRGFPIHRLCASGFGRKRGAPRGASALFRDTATRSVF